MAWGCRSATSGGARALEKTCNPTPEGDCLHRYTGMGANGPGVHEVANSSCIAEPVFSRKTLRVASPMVSLRMSSDVTWKSSLIFLICALRINVFPHSQRHTVSFETSSMDASCACVRCSSRLSSRMLSPALMFHHAIRRSGRQRLQGPPKP